MTKSNARLGNVLIAVGQGYRVGERAACINMGRALRAQVCEKVAAGELSLTAGGEQLGVKYTTMRNIMTAWRRHRQVLPDDPIGEMAMKVASPWGRTIYKKRSTMIEPVFGQIKHSRRLPGFSVKGLKSVKSEWQLVCAVHNLLKLAKYPT
ncbi:MAG: transposase [Propionibacteriaceae bacterium]|nr:transposase [Propionibacteriaceae bacterium]